MEVAMIIVNQYNYLTTGQVDGHQITLGGLDLALQEALLFVRHPACLFAIVRLALVDTLLFQRNEQVRSRIGVLALLDNRLRHFGGLTRLLGYSRHENVALEPSCNTRGTLVNRYNFIVGDKAAERRVRLFVAVTRVVAARERCQLASLRNADFYARVFY